MHRQSTIRFRAALIPCLLLICVETGCRDAGPPEQRQRIQVDSNSVRLESVQVELKLDSGHGLLFTDAVAINGQQVGHFLVDTGANITVLAAEAAKSLGVNAGDASLDVNGRQVGGIASVELSLGPVTIRRHPVGIMDLAPLQKFTKPVVGILGADVLGKIPFTLDYREARLVLHDPAWFTPPAEAKRFDLKIVKLQSGPGLAGTDESVGTPAIMSQVNGHEITLVLDTGLSRGVFIGRSDASKQPVRIGRPVPPLREAAVVAGQESNMYVFDVAEMDVLGKRWRDLPFAMTPVSSSDAQGTPEDEPRISAIGGTLLREYRLTFDMPHRRLWVSRSEVPQMPAAVIEGKNFAGVPPVVEAVEYADVPMLNRLLASNASLRFRSESGYNILHSAVLGGSAQCMEMLLSQEGHPKLSEATPDGVTPLILAAGLCEPELVQVMLKAGAAPNARTDTGHTALHAAADSGCLLAATFLLQAGAKPDATQADGQPPMALAAGKGDAAMVRLLLESGGGLDWTADNGGSILHFAAYGGNTDILQLALAKLPKVAIDRTSKQGATPLMIAAERGNVAFARGLIDAGADATKRTGIHASLGTLAAIHYAAMKGRSEVVQLLLQNGVPPDQATGRGLTPLMLAAGVGDIASVKALLGAGAQANKSDNDKMTALHYAAKRGQPAVIPLLVRAGAPVAAAAAKGVRPLDFAALRGDKDVARVLVEAGADPMEKGEHGLSAVDLAEQQTHNDLAGLLHKWSRRSSEAVDSK